MSWTTRRWTFSTLHVDDMMSCGMKSKVEKLIQELKSELNISYKIASMKEISSSS